ncbi:hypothetical protein F4810DRAFT_145288 [Camillea tinctor]|nr:hypothetical protein F4810DRAFT_145288 [Camillea tinctor]
MSCGLDNFGKLTQLRTHFSPGHISTTADKYYFGTLQVLSPSRYIINEAIALDETDHFHELKNLYDYILDNASPGDVRDQKSIQVAGPEGYANSIIMKLFTQEIRQAFSAIVIDHFADPSHLAYTPTIYGIYVSFIHQTLSQRPSLFRPVQNWAAQIIPI